MLRQLVDQADRGPAADDSVAVHLAELDPVVLDDSRGDDLEIGDLLGRLGPPVGLDEADDHVDPLLLQPLAFPEHGVCLAHAGRRAEIDLEPTPGLTADQVEELFRGGSAWLHVGHVHVPR